MLAQSILAVVMSYLIQLFISDDGPLDANSGSDSGDQFKPDEHPESEEEDDLEDDVESEERSGNESTNNESTKVNPKKGKHKPGRNDIKAARKTNAISGTPSTNTSRSGPQEKEVKSW